jgi:hypothetical protein
MSSQDLKGYLFFYSAIEWTLLLSSTFEPLKPVTWENAILTGEIISGGSGIAFPGTTQLNNPGP